MDDDGALLNNIMPPGAVTLVVAISMEMPRGEMVEGGHCWEI